MTYAVPGVTNYLLKLRATSEEYSPNSGISAASPNGAFSIDPADNPTLMKEAIFRTAAKSSKEASFQLEKRADAFRQIVGREPHGVPIVVSAVVTATNSAGQRTGLFHNYLVEVPVPEFDR
jgi:hypothetical protein